MKEVWKTIKTYPDYKVNNLGNIYSTITNKQLKLWLRGSRKNNKYLVVELKGKTLFVHRLVAEAFIPNPNNLPQVNHKDGNKLNNNVDNLEWCDASYNQQHAIRTGLKRYCYGSKNKVCKLTINDVKYIKENFIYKDHEYGAIAMGKRYNVDKKTIMNIINNKTYRDVKCTYKLFFCSDIHGCYDYFVKALNKAGFNELKYNHKLVVLGDIFDRSNQNIEVFNWLYRLTNSGKAIVTSGNHHKFLIDFLEGSYNPFNYLHNGLRETIADFWHRTAPFESWCMLEGNCEMNQENYAKWVDICRKDIMEEYPKLLPWLKSLPRYFESKNYIGVHGAIDTNVPDWHYPHCYRYNLRDWDALDFDDGSFFGKEILNTGKNIIIGHFGAQALREMYNMDKDNKNQFAPLLSKNGRILAIDATTNYSRQVNVAVIEDELL